MIQMYFKKEKKKRNVIKGNFSLSFPEMNFKNIQQNILCVEEINDKCNCKIFVISLAEAMDKHWIRSGNKMKRKTLNML